MKSVKDFNINNFRSQIRIGFAVCFVFLLFQNCQKVAVEDLSSNKVVTTSGTQDPNPPDLEVCQTASCTLDPIVQKPAVTLILLALGDEANDQLVVDGGSARLIAETVIRQTTPVKNPKILLLIDANRAGEDLEDSEYAFSELLKSYQVERLLEPAEGISIGQLTGYDLVWLNNPGHPMNSKATQDALLEFKGGVVMQGDDLSRGSDFSVTDLTHVKYEDNGVTAQCGGEQVTIDNNQGGQYLISLDSKYFPKINNQQVKFVYGNDIDLVSFIDSHPVEVLASAAVNKEGCADSRPVVLRYFKEDPPRSLSKE